MNTLKKILIWVLIIGVILLLGRNIIAKQAAQIGCKIFTGFKLKIDKVSIGLIKTDFGIKGLKIYNPQGFEEKIMLDLPVFYVDYNLKDIISGKMHLTEVVLNLSRLNIVRSSEDILNVEVLMNKAAKKGNKQTDKKKTKPDNKNKNRKELDLQIDKIKLKLGVISFMDYSKDAQNPSINNLEINLDEEYNNITNPALFGANVMQKVFRNVAMSKISGFDLGVLNSSFQGVFNGAGEFAGATLNTAKGVAGSAVNQVKNLSSAIDVKEISSTAQETVKVATDTLKKSASTIKNLGGKLLSPFAKDE